MKGGKRGLVGFGLAGTEVKANDIDIDMFEL